MKRYSVNVHCDVVIPIDNIIAENESEALSKALKMAENMPVIDYGELVDFTQPCVTDVEDIIPIMDTSNNHNKELVNKINKAYFANRSEFESIVALLMARDKAECEEKDVNKDVHLYLMRVADDEDLVCILKYLRVD